MTSGNVSCVDLCELLLVASSLLWHCGFGQGRWKVACGLEVAHGNVKGLLLELKTGISGGSSSPAMIHPFEACIPLGLALPRVALGSPSCSWKYPNLILKPLTSDEMTNFGKLLGYAASRTKCLVDFPRHNELEALLKMLADKEMKGRKEN